MLRCSQILSPKASVYGEFDASLYLRCACSWACALPRRFMPITLSSRLRDRLPVTTTSAQARALYEKGMEDYENLYLERCNERLARRSKKKIRTWLWPGALDRLQQH